MNNVPPIKKKWTTFLLILYFHRITICLLNLPVLWVYHRVAYFRYYDISNPATYDVMVECSSYNQSLAGEQLTNNGSLPLYDLQTLWTDVLIRILIPFLLMLASNVIIIITHYYTLPRRLSMSANSDARAESAEWQMLTFMLLRATFSHLLLTIPAVIQFVLDPLLHLIDPKTIGILWNKIVLLLIYMDYSVNFLLYSMNGRRVRDEFFGMVGLLSWRSRSISSRTTVTTTSTSKRSRFSSSGDSHGGTSTYMPVKQPLIEDSPPNSARGQTWLGTNGSYAALSSMPTLGQWSRYTISKYCSTKHYKLWIFYSRLFQK